MSSFSSTECPERLLSWDKNLRVESDLRNHSQLTLLRTLIGDDLFPMKKMPSLGLCSHPILCVRKPGYFQN